ncbi:serine-rich adhesin for platelets [Drosophila pseudoobscura]|uniref:Serine-rich adhesin for platelets n=1 Tax=Drosophila pseudoobscura pseudoobscura TaxID=46245 RepID=A0A6I8UP59_DROPS|nr:serine-rich adhesin for platelets [Drosophila pseudoobscura]
MGMVETATSEYRLEANTSYTYLLVTLNLTLTLIVMLGACLCCKKKIPKNDLLGLEGMVKLKNPDEVIVVTSLVGNSESQAELNASTVSNADSEKRSSTAAHRSLPDIPVAESNDNGSELYETVADKQLVDALNARSQSPQPSLKKQTSVSQHSSISQADDVSSPYSRVKGLPHDYAKVRGTEHPYAQLNAPSTSHSAQGAAAAAAAVVAGSSSEGADHLHRSSQHSDGSRDHNDSAPAQVEIPAASAIAGMISASQDLPYMTPPIANQHFSGDSQDSSKGYTSISVREPLANILAQQPPGKPPNRNASLARDGNDSHYATVSDDSDETYAAIEDPNNRHPTNAADIYTSGSETYAQIQPMQINPIVVAVEINNSSSLPTTSSAAGVVSGGTQSGALRPTNSNIGATDHAVPVPPPVDSLRAQMHSRQASSSSNNSTSVCNLGSPKPEKRQANSPLPPTPKSSAHLHASSISNLASARNSVISVIEAGGDGHEVEASAEASPQRKHSKSLSPSKDGGGEGNKNIEGMYAKVMKKHKFSRNSPSSQNSSPILTRKQQQDTLGVSPLDSAAALLVDPQKGARVRSNSYSAKDHGYETIPADGQLMHENRKSDCYAANMLQKERQHEGAIAPQPVTKATATGISGASTKHYETISQPTPPPPPPSKCNNDPGYEQLQLHPVHTEDDAKKSDYDPNYEVLKSRAHSDDGYAKVLEKKRAPTGDAGGYSTIPGADANHNYASILETKATAETDHYARIAENVAASTPGSTSNSSRLTLTSPTSTSTSNSLSLNSSTVATSTPISSQYESLTGTGSETDPNYESVCYLTTGATATTTTTTSTSSGGGFVEHAYEPLQADLESDTQASSPMSGATATSTPSEQLLVDDYFHV